MSDYPFNVACPQCKQIFMCDCYVESLQIDSTGKRIQVRGECPYCRVWIRWISYKESEYVKNILRLFYHNDMEALKKLRETAVLDYKKQEIR